MKNCINCGSAMEENAVFCPNCGTQSAQEQTTSVPPVQEATPNVGYVPPQMYYVDASDHTAEFDGTDISENKVIALTPYLFGWLGIIVCLLAGKSPYVSFHVRQVIKIEILNVLLGIISLLLLWTFIVPMAAGICAIILFVVRIIGFFWVCGGKAKELPIVKSMRFLK